MIVNKFILVLIALWGCLLIMKDLTDFVALGKDLGITSDKLLPFAEAKYDAYLKSYNEDKKLETERAEKEAERAERALKLENERADKEAERAKAAHERELRLLERRAQIAQDERAVAETAGSGGRVPHPMSHHSDLLPLMISQMTLILGSHCLENNALLIMSRIETGKRICYLYFPANTEKLFYP